jgi:hypothetical protein
MPGPIPVLPGSLKPRLREVSSLPSWLYCFLAYVAILAPDQGTRDMLAYARLLIREAQRHGGVGWMDYDRVFRQQAAIDRSLQWNTLNPGIQSSTITGQAPRPNTFCTLCHEVDHTAASCALAYLEPSGPPSPPTTQRSAKRRTSYSICMSWNRGKCTYPGACTFRHVCSQCYQLHRACDCPSSSAAPVGRSTWEASRSHRAAPASSSGIASKHK